MSRLTYARLHAALADLDVTKKVQIVEIPPRLSPPYFQKYTHMLAERWGMQVNTRVLGGLMMIQERESAKTASGLSPL